MIYEPYNTHNAKCIANPLICLDLDTSKAQSHRIKCSTAMQFVIGVVSWASHRIAFHLRPQNRLINCSRIIKHFNWMRKTVGINGFESEKLLINDARHFCVSNCDAELKVHCEVELVKSEVQILNIFDNLLLAVSFRHCQMPNFLPWWTNEYFTCDNCVRLHFKALILVRCTRLSNMTQFGFVEYTNTIEHLGTRTSICV